MSNHYANSVIAVSPHSNRTYSVPKFEKENHRRSRSLTGPSNSNSSNNLNHSNHSTNSSNGKIALIPTTTPRGKRIIIPAAVTPNQRSASFTSPCLVNPQSFDFESVTIEEPKSPHGLRTTRSLSVIGLPSEYPVFQRDGSVVSSFASSVASSLVMEELDDFEAFFADDSVPKVFDSYSCSSKESPLKSDRSHPPRPPVQIQSSVRPRTLSPPEIPTTTEYSMPAAPIQKPYNLSSRRISDSSLSVGSRDSLSTRSSRSRRLRNYGMSENDFEKLSDEFSSLIVQ